MRRQIINDTIDWFLWYRAGAPEWLGSLFRDAQRHTLPMLLDTPIETWPSWFGLLQGIGAPSTAPPAPVKSPAGPANPKILFECLRRTKEIPGDIAECGVFTGRTLLAMGLYLRSLASAKTIFGFDSFEGFDNSVTVDLELGGAPDPQKRQQGFSETSFEEVNDRIAELGLSSSVILEKGFFNSSLRRHETRRFSFVHLDCDIYDSYKTCLEFFYERVNPGGIILFDEYNDAPWPGCNKAVDEFLRDKPDTLQEIEIDNYQKWFIRRG